MLNQKQKIVASLLCSLGVSSIGLAEPPVLLAPPKSAKPIELSNQASAEDRIPEKSPEKTEIAPAARVSDTESLNNVGKAPKKTLSTTSAVAVEVGYVSLLPGRNLEGWEVHQGREESWQRNGNIISSQGSGGGWLRTIEQFSDYHLKFEYRLAAGANSGIGLRCPEQGNPTFAGIEIQLLDDSSPKYAKLRPDQYTGSVYYHAAPTTSPVLAPAGQWNRCEVICKGDLITIQLNGRTMNEVNLAKPREIAQGEKPKVWQLAKRPPAGKIALQSSTAQVEFRNLMLKDLTQTTPSGVKIVDLKIGEGELIGDAKNFSVHYVGQLANGTRFGDTRSFGDPINVSTDGVIEGWIHGIKGMRIGGQRRLIVPPEMAYGTAGVENLIPPGATLYFEVELCDIER